MSVRIPDFYLFPAFGGPSLSAQYPTLRESFGWLNAAMRNSYIDESTNLTTHVFNALAYGELMQRFKFRWRYDASNDEFQLQQNSTDNEANPTWTTLIKIRESDGRVTIVSPGGLLAIGGFYNLGGLDVGVTQLGGGAFGNVGTLLFDSNSGFYLSADSSGRPIVSVNAAALAGVLTDLANAGGGAQVFQGKVASTATLRSIVAGTNVTVQQNTNDITISSSAPSGEVNTASNLGSGFGIWFDKQGVDLRFKSLVGVDGVNISATPSEVQISAPEFYLEVKESEAGGFRKRTDKLTFSPEFYLGSAGDGSPLVSLSGQAVSNSTISNLGAGAGVFAQKVIDDFQFKTLVAGTNITITPTATDLTIDAAAGGASSTASNLGAGDGVFAQQVADDLQFKSLTAGPGIVLTPSANELQITSTGGGGDSGTFYGVTFKESNPGGRLQRADTLVFDKQFFYLTQAGDDGQPLLSLHSVPPGARSQEFASQPEWAFNHNLGTSDLLWGTFDNRQKAIIPEIVDFSSPNTAYFYFGSNVTGRALVSPGGGGSAGGASPELTASNLGTGSGLFAQKTGVYLEFKSLKAGAGVSLTPSASELQIASTPILSVNDGVETFNGVSNLSFSGQDFYLSLDTAGRAEVNLVRKSSWCVMGSSGGLLAATVTRAVSYSTVNDVGPFFMLRPGRIVGLTFSLNTSDGLISSGTLTYSLFINSATAQSIVMNGTTEAATVTRELNIPYVITDAISGQFATAGLNPANRWATIMLFMEDN